MLTIVDRVMSKPTLNHPMSDAQSAAVREEALRFAAKLLENYKGQLSRRMMADPAPPSNAS